MHLRWRRARREQQQQQQQQQQQHQQNTAGTEETTFETNLLGLNQKEALPERIPGRI
jgi:hypothetical protein